MTSRGFGSTLGPSKRMLDGEKCGFHAWRDVDTTDGAVVMQKCSRCSKTRTLRFTASTPARGRMLKRTQPRRDWSQALEKRDREGCCRVCGSTLVQAAHVVGRDRDGTAPINMAHDDAWDWSREPLVVWPTRIVPLCGRCHDRYDGRAQPPLDLLGRLTTEEELQAVADSAVRGTRESAIENARRRLAPSQYRAERKDAV